MEVKKGPWVVNDSIIKYKNPWMSVREDQVTRPDGKPGIFGVVTMIPGVSVLPLDDDGYVFLVEEYHYAVERVTTEVISGGINLGEETLDAAKRELKEETGISATEWNELGDVDPFTTVVNCPNYLFLARGLTHSDSDPEGTEQIKVVRIPFIKAVDMVLKSKITHGASVGLILKAKAFLGK